MKGSWSRLVVGGQLFKHCGCSNPCPWCLVEDLRSMGDTLSSRVDEMVVGGLATNGTSCASLVGLLVGTKNYHWTPLH